MSVQSDVANAIAFTGLPIYNNTFSGIGDAYFVLTISTIPVEFADDEPQAEKSLIMLHLCCPHTLNTNTLKSQVKRALCAAGFTYPAETDASDESAQHIIFECEDVRGIDYGAT